MNLVLWAIDILLKKKAEYFVGFFALLAFCVSKVLLTQNIKCFEFVESCVSNFSSYSMLKYFGFSININICFVIINKSGFSIKQMFACAVNFSKFKTKDLRV